MTRPNRLLRRLFWKSPNACSRVRLQLEHLEPRTLPTSVFVVPLTVATDATHFHALADACVAAGANGPDALEMAIGLMIDLCNKRVESSWRVTRFRV
jgi:hypothetical protein